MGSSLPEWWLNLSGVFFGLSILLLIALLVAVFYMIAALKQLSQRIQLLATRVEEISTKVHELVENVTVTSSAVGGHAQNIAGSLEVFSQALAARAQTISIVFTGLALLRNLLARRRNS